MKNLMFISLLFSISGCANYVKALHNEIDQGLGSARKQEFKRKKNKFSFYRNGYYENHNRYSSKHSKQLYPNIKRQYSSNEKKRYTADDLIDKESDGSLWNNNGTNSFLFSKNKTLRNGDIITVQIQKRLKNEISLELKRAFPLRKLGNKKAGAAGETATKTASEKGSEENGGDDKVFDKISSIIIEEINKDHVLLKGRKDVLFRKRKRTLELEGLIARKDISDDDSVLSDNLLESNIYIIK